MTGSHLLTDYFAGLCRHLILRGVDTQWINTGLTLTPDDKALLFIIQYKQIPENRFDSSLEPGTCLVVFSFFFFLYRDKGARTGVKGVQVHKRKRGLRAG